MKINIKKKEVKMFALGFIAAVIFNVLSDWEGSVESIKEGYTAGQEIIGRTD